ncbi:MAG: hypothetical protein UHD05_07360 [Ruminococcus sp.]|nr:hypothetical protein [Ruminococcus sp.]
MNKFLTKLAVKKEMAKLGLRNIADKFKTENGDTNFISIIIILGIVIILVGVFVAFKDSIIGTIEGIVDGFGAGTLSGSGLSTP